MLTTGLSLLHTLESLFELKIALISWRQSLILRFYEEMD